MLLAWLVTAGVLIPVGQQLTDVQQDDTGQWLPRSAEATMAYERERAAYPESRATPAIVVYVRDGGLTAADRARVDADREELAGRAWQGQAGPVVTAADGAAVLYTLPLPGAGTPDRQRLHDMVVEIRDRARAAAPAGLRVEVAGPAAVVADLADAFTGIDVTLLLTTLTVVALILLITYRSPVLWLVPLLTVVVASQVTEGLVYLLARYGGLTVSGQNAGILTVLVFGAGTDYALLLVARYREELRRHHDRHQAMRVALGRTYPTILASGTTVILGMLCLLAARMEGIRGLGPVAAVGIGVALLAMTSLLPALLVIFGRWLFWPLVPRVAAGSTHGPGGDHPSGRDLWARVATAVGRRPRLIWLGTTAALAALASGTLTLGFGMSQEDTFTTTVRSTIAQRVMERHFGVGLAAPATIYTTPATTQAVASAARAVDGVAGVGEPRPAPDGSWVALDAVLRDPFDSVAARRTVTLLRDAVHAVPGSQALVGGVTATRLDTEESMIRDTSVVVPLIMVTVLLVLVVLLRSLVAPVLLIASVVVSFLGALGTVALVLSALGRSSTERALPLYGFLFLIALGVDYTVFLMGRAREETARVGTRAGVLRALAVTGGVVTSAGVLLAATFGVLTVMPLTFMLHLGLLIAIGVLFDTLVVRTLLVPALAVDIGPRIWWPGALRWCDVAAGDGEPAVDQPAGAGARGRELLVGNP